MFPIDGHHSWNRTSSPLWINHAWPPWTISFHTYIMPSCIESCLYCLFNYVITILYAETLVTCTIHWTNSTTVIHSWLHFISMNVDELTEKFETGSVGEVPFCVLYTDDWNAVSCLIQLHNSHLLYQYRELSKTVTVSWLNHKLNLSQWTFVCKEWYCISYHTETPKNNIRSVVVTAWKVIHHGIWVP